MQEKEDGNWSEGMIEHRTGGGDLRLPNVHEIQTKKTEEKDMVKYICATYGSYYSILH